MQTIQDFFKCPRLTKEERDFFLKRESFFKKLNVNLWAWPLRERIGNALQSLAVVKLVGGGWEITLDEVNKEEAIEHHIKACFYNPSVAFRSPTFRKEAGLPAHNECSV
jgi:hypothetical protein